VREALLSEDDRAAYRLWREARERLVRVQKDYFFHGHLREVRAAYEASRTEYREARQLAWDAGFDVDGGPRWR
jgi:hypothetical protein